MSVALRIIRCSPVQLLMAVLLALANSLVTDGIR
jgi:hypothetical protein